MKTLSELTPPIALGPLDGRYRATAAPLVDYLSEAALNRERIIIETEWLIYLAESGALPGAPTLSETQISYLRSIAEDFDAADIAELADIEAETRHDVKAVEYFLKRRLAAAPTVLGASEGEGLAAAAEMVHILATSEDVNNLAYARGVRGAVREVWLPAVHAFTDQLAEFARTHADQPMLARTHGQSATPTTLGKEMAVFTARLRRQLRRIEQAEFCGKFNGATGTFSAHTVALPGADWLALSRGFVERLGLAWNPLTTQIEPHDWQVSLYADIAHANRIAHNLATDVWAYISRGYLRQSLAAHGSTGSSTMPHKVNPIRFENAEANLEISSALLDTLCATLPTTRFQRDLTDSTTQRNIGVALGHSLLAFDNLARGMAGLEANAPVIHAELEGAWEVLGEAIQQAMRVQGVAGTPGMDRPYERLKEFTRGRSVDGPAMAEFIASLGLPAEAQAQLAALTPATYTGLASELTRTYL